MGKPRFEKSGNPFSPWDADRGLSLPFAEPRQPRQSMGRSSGGQPKVTKYGEPERPFKVVLNRLSTSNINNLISFFEHATIDYMMATFTFYPEGSGTSFTVRIVSALDVVRLKGSSLWRAQMTLLQEIT